KALTVTGVTVNAKTYDRTTSATLNISSATLVGVISGDGVTLSATGATSTFQDFNAATGIPVTVTGLALTGTDAPNYSLTQPSVAGDINKKPVTPSITASNKTYDGTTTATLSSQD